MKGSVAILKVLVEFKQLEDPNLDLDPYLHHDVKTQETIYLIAVNMFLTFLVRS